MARIAAPKKRIIKPATAANQKRKRTKSKRVVDQSRSRWSPIMRKQLQEQNDFSVDLFSVISSGPKVPVARPKSPSMLFGDEKRRPVYFGAYSGKSTKIFARKEKKENVVEAPKKNEYAVQAPKREENVVKNHQPQKEIADEITILYQNTTIKKAKPKECAIPEAKIPSKALERKKISQESDDFSLLFNRASPIEKVNPKKCVISEVKLAPRKIAEHKKISRESDVFSSLFNNGNLSIEKVKPKECVKMPEAKVLLRDIVKHKKISEESDDFSSLFNGNSPIEKVKPKKCVLPEAKIPIKEIVEHKKISRESDDFLSLFNRNSSIEKVPKECVKVPEAKIPVKEIVKHKKISQESDNFSSLFDTNSTIEKVRPKDCVLRATKIPLKETVEHKKTLQESADFLSSFKRNSRTEYIVGELNGPKNGSIRFGSHNSKLSILSSSSEIEKDANISRCDLNSQTSVATPNFDEIHCALDELLGFYPEYMKRRKDNLTKIMQDVAAQKERELKRNASNGTRSVQGRNNFIGGVKQLKAELLRELETNSSRLVYFRSYANNDKNTRILDKIEDLRLKSLDNNKTKTESFVKEKKRMIADLRQAMEAKLEEDPPPFYSRFYCYKRRRE